MIFEEDESEEEGGDIFDRDSCYEPIEITEFLDTVNFWIEGIGLVFVASIGLLGNILTVFVISNLDNSSRWVDNTNL